MRRKLFIFGIGGLTGTKLVKIAKSNFEIYGSYNLRKPEFDFLDGIQIDIKNFDKVKQTLNEIKPDLVINTCALNSVDYCENNHDEAIKINVDFVDLLYKITNSLGIRLVQLSTDSVFDGSKTSPYQETDIPNPINFYGHTKLMGEKIVAKNDSNLIVRASVLYGWLERYLTIQNSSSKKSVNFGQWLITKLSLREKVRIITDEISSPIIADDFARSILHLIKNEKSGLFHSAPQIQITRYDFSKRIAERLDLDSKLIEPISNKNLGRDVKTGFNKCLNSTKINKTNFKFLSLDESLELIKKQFLCDLN